jgi:hypothetical protein
MKPFNSKEFLNEGNWFGKRAFGRPAGCPYKEEASPYPEHDLPARPIKESLPHCFCGQSP